MPHLMIFLLILNFIKAEGLCPENHGLDGKGNCRECIVNDNACVDCTTNAWKCDKCKAGWGLDSTGKCESCSIQDCADCNANNAICEKCLKGYGKNSEGKCISCTDNNCIECYANNDRCDNCSTGFLLQNGQCKECIEGCADCHSDINKCDACLEGYKLKNDGTCDQCQISNCANCNSDVNKCDKCKENYGWDSTNSQCTSCQVTNCVECYENYEKCDKCSGDYGVTKENTCEDPHHDSDLHCYAAANTDYDTCFKCNSGYGLDGNGKCKKCGDDCKECYNNYLVCEKCEDEMGPYLLDESNPYYGKCIECNILNPGCKRCASNASVCTACETYYYYMDRVNGSISNGKCVICPSHCKSCTKNVCEYCEYGYGLNEKGECVKCRDSNCIDCSYNYTFCRECGKDDNGNNYKLFDGKCVPCDIENCDECDNSINNYCKECSIGFRKDSDGICIPCPENCARCDSNNECYYPMDGYVLDGSTIKKCITGCSSCSSSLDYCYTCSNGYYRNNKGDCIKSDLFNCSSYNDMHHCSECKKG